MKKVVIYQFFVLCVIAILWVQGPLGNWPNWLVSYESAIDCMLIGTLGGLLYSFRSVYVNYSARKNWDPVWELWYYLRPITSAICGLVAFIFLKAGIIILEADQNQESSNYGYLVFAFIAGLNVDQFLQRIEEIAKTSFGIERTGYSANDNKSRTKDI